MNRAIPSLLALFLVLSLIVGPGMADSGIAIEGMSETSPRNQLSGLMQTNSDPQTATNTTNRLSLEGESKSEYAEYGPDIGAVLASTDDEIRTDHAQYATVDRQYDDATTEERRTLLRNSYEQLKKRSKGLETREQQAVQSHANGDLSNAQLLQILLRNHREAADLSETFDELEARSDRVPDFSLSVSDEQDKLEMHRTEIRSQLESTAYGYGGADADNYIAIETSQNGYVISTLGTNYVREAARFDARDLSRPSQFNGTMDAYRHTQELYPWAYETGQSPSFNEHTTVQLYLFDISHDHGHLRAYLDGGTGDIYREVQVLDRTALPGEGNETAVKNGTKISIRETKEEGPSKVHISDSRTGEPKQATIMINGFEVGKTGIDGSLWYVPPRSGYELTANLSTGSVSTSVD